MSLFECKLFNDLGAGKPNHRNATHTHATQGRSTVKDKCERQFWNGPFCELKERIYDEVHEQSPSTIYEQLTTLWLRNRL